jgi:hypothetical protein
MKRVYIKQKNHLAIVNDFFCVYKINHAEKHGVEHG